MVDRFRLLWDFADLDGTEARLHAALDAEESESGCAEVMAEMARVQGLRGDVEAGERMLEEAAGLAAVGSVAWIRIDLERGRLLRSSDRPEAALPLFDAAHAQARAAGEWFLAGDAAHMAALAAHDLEAMEAWTREGLDVAGEHEEAAYWAGPLLNNLGWAYLGANRAEDALDAFGEALAVRERDPGNGEAVALAHYAVGKALRALSRPGEAIAHLEWSVRWADRQGAPDGWFHEELALTLADEGRYEAAADHARRAIPLLERHDPSYGADRRFVLRDLVARHPVEG